MPREPSLLSVLGSPQAAAFVNAMMLGTYRRTRREGMTHDEASKEALETGDYWLREFLSGVYTHVNDEQVRPRQRAVPQSFIRQRRELQKERLL